MRLLVLYTRLAGYTVACLRRLREVTGSDLLVFAWDPEGNAPFSSETIASLGNIRRRDGKTAQAMLEAARAFRPDAVLVSGWQDRAYADMCRHFKREGIPVIASCDNQWVGNARQRLAMLAAPLHLHRFVDALWVPGERQRVFANALGYRAERCLEGFYACDVQAFGSTTEASRENHRAFLFVGRYVPEKGIDTLAAAYQVYRAAVADPWRLICAGSGPLRDTLVGCGADDRGFVQPSELPRLMAQAGAFILPSLYEPWGVVLQEAAVARLPLIASRACGAAVHLLRDGWNGYAVESGCIDSLVDALVSMHEAGRAVREAMGAASSQLGAQYSPELWTQTLLRGARRLQRLRRATR